MCVCVCVCIKTISDAAELLLLPEVDSSSSNSSLYFHLITPQTFDLFIVVMLNQFVPFLTIHFIPVAIATTAY